MGPNLSEDVVVEMRVRGTFEIDLSMFMSGVPKDMTKETLAKLILGRNWVYEPEVVSAVADNMAHTDEKNITFEVVPDSITILAESDEDDDNDLDSGFDDVDLDFRDLFPDDFLEDPE